MIEACITISECEKKLFFSVANIKLVGEIALSQDEVDKLGALIKQEIYLSNKQEIEYFYDKFSISLSCFLVWKGILDYKEGDYWTSIKDSIGISDPNLLNRIGDMFIKFLKSNSLMYFEIKDAHKNITPILAHGIIPNYCLNEYFEDILLPLFEELIYPDNVNEIIFWLENKRQKNFEIVNIEEEIDSLEIPEISLKKVFYESLVATWDEFEKIKKLQNNSYNVNQLNSLIQELSEYETKKQIRTDIQRRILKFEDNIRELENKIRIFSEHKAILEHLDDINQCSTTLSGLKIGIKELIELNVLKSSLEKKIFEANVIFSEPWNDINIEFLEQIPFNELKKKVEEFKSARTKGLEEEKILLIRLFKGILNYIFYIFKINGKINEQFHLKEIKEILQNLPVDEKQFTVPDDLIKNLELFKENIEDLSILKSKINAAETINRERIQTINNVAVTLEIDISKDANQIVLIMQNRIEEAKMHEESAAISEKTIKKIKLSLDELRNEILSLEDEIQEIEKRLADQGNGDIESGIEKIKQCQKALADTDSIKCSSLKNYPDFYALQREKIEADLKGIDKNHYVEEVEKMSEELQHIDEKINELNSKKNAISIPFRYIDEPIRRFLLYGNSFADNFLIESVRMIKLAKEGRSSILINELKLPERIIIKFCEWWKQHYLFRWDEVPGRDSDILKNFLIQNVGFEWIRSAIIEKLDDITIKVSGGDQSILLKLNSEKTRVILTSADIIIDEFIVKIDSGKMKIYESKPIIYLDDGEIKVRIPSLQFNYCCNSVDFIMKFGQDQYKEDLRIYESNNNSYITDELNLVVDSPSEKYEFLIKTDTGELLNHSIIGISPIHPFLVFDYISNKLIQKNINQEIPRNEVWIISRDTCNFEPEIHIIEEQPLSGKWNGFIARAIDLKNIDQLFLCDKGKKYQIPLIHIQVLKPKIYGEKIDFASSDGKDVFINEAPYIAIPYTSINELDNCSVHIFPIISEFNDSKHISLKDISDELRLEGDQCYLQLSNGKFIGNAFGEFKVRIKNEFANKDIEFNFCVIPWMKLDFEKSIYFPHREEAQAVYLDIECSKGFKFIPDKPAQTTNQDGNTCFVKSIASERSINGSINKNSLSIPINIFIPRVTWFLEGTKINKYIFESLDVGELSEDEWEDAINEELSLIVNLPQTVDGKVQLSLHNSFKQNDTEKIKDGKVIFDLRKFTDTIRESTDSVQEFKLIMLESPLFQEVSLFSIQKWQVKNIETEQTRDNEGKNNLIDVKWEEIGKSKNRVVSLWQLKDKPILIWEETISYASGNYTQIILNESEYSLGRYHIQVSKDRKFSGEHSHNSKEIFIQLEGYLIEIGNEEFIKGNYIEAIRIYKRVSKEKPELGDIWKHKINNGLIHRKKYRETITAFDQILNTESEFSGTDFSFIALNLKNLSMDKKISEDIRVEILFLILDIFSTKITPKSTKKKEVKKPIKSRKKIKYILKSDIGSAYIENKYDNFSKIIEPHKNEIWPVLIEAVRNKYNNEDVTELKNNIYHENYAKSFEILQQFMRNYYNVSKSN